MVEVSTVVCVPIEVKKDSYYVGQQSNQEFVYLSWGGTKEYKTLLGFWCPL